MTHAPARRAPLHVTLLAALGCLIALAIAPPAARAADRDSIRDFLNVTGFDIALDSIAFSAGSAPQMLGVQPDAFGADWTRVSGSVFDTAIMRKMALDILEQTLTQENLDHAVDFYASDLGQRLVEVENASHSESDDSIAQTGGAEILADLSETDRGQARIATLERMMAAIDSAGMSLRAIQEIQVRFLVSAAAAGVIELRMDPEELRAAMKTQEDEMRTALMESSMKSAAFTYKDISDADLIAYAEALEAPQMQEVYQLLNAVQYEIMANRFEVLAARMADLHPGQDI